MIIQFLLLVLCLIISGCDRPRYENREEITKYVESKYSSELISSNVKYLKCLPENGTIRAIYSIDYTDNAYPAVIRIDFKNKKMQNVLFDESYLLGDKNTLLKDIDVCFTSWQQLKHARDSWS